MALLAGLALPAAAQESRGSIQGTITDPQKAVLPGATVTVVNPTTNVSRTVVTNDVGYYEVPFLDAGSYTLSAEMTGFKKAVRTGVVVNVGLKSVVDLQLEVGGVSETVTVSDVAPLLDTTSASSGRVIDTGMMASLPFSDLNPFALSAMAAGMQWTGQPEYRRPFDNGGTSSFNTAGGVGQNEYTLDGAPVTGTGRRVGFVPPADAVQEFNLQTAAFDASVGHTSGALINVVSRSGSNDWHGALYEQHWQQRWNATQHFARLAYEANQKAGRLKPGEQKQGTGRSNQFGGTVGGPVRFPWLYNGKDKFFFFFSYNGIYQSKAETTDSVNRTVPKMAWRQGDFSDLLAIDPARYQIYDPRTARLVAGRVVRDPFPGNRGIPILNPMYKYYVDIYPKPNDVPGLVNAEGANNYLATAMPKDERFNSILNRYDFNINDQMRLAGKWYWNHRLADEYDWTYETVRGLHTNGLTRINKGGSGDFTWTVNNSNVFQAGVSLTRFLEGSERSIPNKYKPTDVGLPKYLDDKAADLHLLPRLDFDVVEDVGSGYATVGSIGTTEEVKLTMNSIWKKHSMKYGFVERRYRFAASGPGDTSGVFTFRNTWMRSRDNDNVASHRGLEWAAFMMGVPNGISISGNDSGFFENPYRALYLQDDWRLTRKLTINLGLRWEFEGGISERFNRGIESGFQYDAMLPISSLVEAAYGTVYAANPGIGLLPPSQFRIRGGVPYLGQSNETWTDGAWKLLPRLGMALQLSGKTVLRIGYGAFFDTLNVNNSRPDQYGFSRGTSPVISTDNGLTFFTGSANFPASAVSASKNLLTDPFPTRDDGTRFDVPLRNALGLMSRVGIGFSPGLFREFQPAYQQRWRLGIQHQLKRDIAVEASYAGAYSSQHASNQRVDYLPAQYWTTGMRRDQANDDNLNQNVTNPFRVTNLTSLQTGNPVLWNYLNTQGFFTSSTIRKHTLLRAFPHMGGLTYIRPGVNPDDVKAKINYGDIELRIEKRMSHGVSSTFSWTRTFKSSIADFYWNEFDTALSSRPNNNTRPNRFVWDAIVELPFGKGRQWLQGGALEPILGGWELGWIMQRQDGAATGWGNRFYYGDFSHIKDAFRHEEVFKKDLHQWFDPNIPFEKTAAAQPGSYHVRVFPTRLEQLREDGIDNWDIKVQKKFRVPAMGEQSMTSVSVDILNAFNHTNFSGPNTDPTSSNFGKVTSQRGLSRVIQFNLRITF